jgi:hypothetical protein
MPDFFEDLEVQITLQNFGQLEQMQPAFEKAMERLETFNKIAPKMTDIVEELEKVAQILDQENGSNLNEYIRAKNQNN